MIRRIFDRMQVTLHLLGFHRLATFVGRFGSPALPSSEIDIHDRPTLKVPVYVTSSHRGVNYCLVDEDKPMQILDFDPTFNNNPGIDVGQDIVFPSSKYDIN